MDLRTTTPFAIVRQAEHVQQAEKSTLLAVTRALEREALDDPPPAVAATLQDARYLTDATRAVYARLAAQGSPATLFARSLQAWLAPGVRGVALEDDDPLVDEWTVVLPGGRHPVVFAATDCGLVGVPDPAREFCFAISREPEVVAAVADVLGMTRAAPPGRGNGRAGDAVQ